MRIDFNTRSADSYRLFLKVRRCPIYQFKGTSAIVPDEYAKSLGLKPARRWNTKYDPIDGLFDYQEAITGTSIRKRKYAIFADCGLGKTMMILEFSRHAANVSGGKILIVSPLMVCNQTVDEAAKWYGADCGIHRVRAAELQDWLNTPGEAIAVTNYEAIREGLLPGHLTGLILDESSMLKSHYGAWGTRLIELGRGLEWKLCATGTPAPNDRIEFANHAVFLDRAKTVNEFLASYFINRGETQNRWELKPHALKPFYRSLADWSIFLTNPATYGWKDNVGVTPPIHIHVDHIDLTDEQRKAAQAVTGSLMVNSIGGIGDRGKLSQIAKGKGGIETLKPHFIRDLVATWPDESTIIWCHYNDEQESMERMFPDAVSISGDTPEETRQIYIDYFQGRICRCEMLNRTKRTCKSITETTNIDGQKDPEKSRTSTTPSGESNTRRMSQSEIKRERRPKTGRKTIQEKGLTKISGNTESMLINTSTCSVSRMESAQSAGHCLKADTGGQQDCTLITATQQALSGGFSAETAITESASSRTTQNCSTSLRCTCESKSAVGRILISKPRLIGFGLNLQICTRQVFSGLKDSYEEFYQAVKRSNRIGSTRPLNVHIPVTELESPFVDNVLRKAGRVQSDTEQQEQLFKELCNESFRN